MATATRSRRFRRGARLSLPPLVSLAALAIALGAGHLGPALTPSAPAPAELRVDALRPAGLDAPALDPTALAAPHAVAVSARATTPDRKVRADATGGRSLPDAAPPLHPVAVAPRVAVPVAAAARSPRQVRAPPRRHR